MTRSWERLGGIAGVLFFVVLVASFFTPETPDADDPTGEIVRQLADDRTGVIAGVYLGGLATVFFLIYVGALWSRLRRHEPGPGPSVLVALGGLGTGVIILIANAVLYATVEAADDRREPEAVRALFQLDEVVFLVLGFTSAVFYAGAALSGTWSRGLPRWLSASAAVLALAFLVCLLGLFSEDEEGGVLGGIFFIAVLLNFLWILATSILLLRARTEDRAEGPSPPLSPAAPPG